MAIEKYKALSAIRANMKKKSNYLITHPLIMTALEIIIRNGGAAIILPIVIINLTKSELTFYLFINTLVSMALLADAGFASTIIRYASYLKAEAAEKCMKSKKNTMGLEGFCLSDLVATTRLIYAVLSLMILIVLCTFGLIISHKIILDQSDVRLGYISFFLIVINSIILLQATRWSSFLQGLNEVSLAKRLEIYVSLVRVGGIVVSVIFKLGINGIALALTISSLLSYYLGKHFVYEHQFLVGLVKCNSKFNRGMFSHMWPSTWRVGLISAGGFLINFGGSLVAAQLANDNEASSYLLTFQLLSILQRLSLAPLVAYGPSLVMESVSGEWSKVNKITTKVVRASVIIYLVGGAVLYLLGDPALKYIGAKANILQGWYLLVMILMNFLEVHHSIHASIYMSSNHVPFVIPSLFSGLVICVGGYMLADFYGLIAIIGVQFVVQLLFNNWYPVYLSLKYQKLSWNNYIKQIFYLGSLRDLMQRG